GRPLSWVTTIDFWARRGSACWSTRTQTLPTPIAKRHGAAITRAHHSKRRRSLEDVAVQRQERATRRTPTRWRSHLGFVRGGVVRQRGGEERAVPLPVGVAEGREDQPHVGVVGVSCLIILLRHVILEDALHDVRPDENELFERCDGVGAPVA